MAIGRVVARSMPSRKTLRLLCRRYTDVVLAADQEVDGLCLRRIPDEARHRRKGVAQALRLLPVIVTIPAALKGTSASYEGLSWLCGPNGTPEKLIAPI